MSCNYCRYTSIKKNKPKGSKIVLQPSIWGLGGVEVYVVPKGERLDERSPDHGGKQWQAWFQELTMHCVC